MGKASRLKRQNGNDSVSFSASYNNNGEHEDRIFLSSKNQDKDDKFSQPCESISENHDKDDKVSQPCQKCEDEISKLRQLNQILVRNINTSRDKVVDMESQIHILHAASTNFELKMDNQLIQQVKIGEHLSDQLMEIDKEFRQQLAKRDAEYEAEISKAWQQLQEAEERFKREISEKEADCRAVFADKQTLETTVLQLTDKIKVTSAEFAAARKAWELEKNGLSSEIVAAREESEEIAKSSLIAEQAWNADRENLLSSLRKTYEEKIEDISTQNERVLLEKIELLEKIDDDRHLWESEKQALQANAAELQVKIDSIATERELLGQKNKAVSIEAEFLHTQLNEYKAKLAQMEEERVQNGRVLQQCRTENTDLQSELNDSKRRTQDLLRKNEEDKHLWDAEKSNLEGTVAELKTKHELIASEMESMTQKNRELTVHSELIKNQVIALESELNESKKMTLELLQKIDDDRHLWESEKQTLQANAAELQVKIDSIATERELLGQKNKAVSIEAEFLHTQLNEHKAKLAQMEEERVQNGRVLQQCRTENTDLQSELNDSKRRTQDLLRKNEEDKHLWDAEKSNLEGTVAELKTKHELIANEMESMTQKNRELTVHSELIKNQVIALESELNESKKMTLELLQKIDDDRHLWDSEKQTLQANAAELQVKIDSIATERELLGQKNKAVSTEAEFLHTQLNEHKAKLAQIEEERVQNGRFLQQCRTENTDLQSELNDSKRRTQDLLRKYEEDKHLWDAEKSNLEGTVAELKTKHELITSEMESMTQKNRELTVHSELIKNQVIALESELNESKKMTLELLQKIDDDRHLWDSEKQTLQANAAELQVKIDSIATERELLGQKNKAVSTEAEFLHTQLNEHKAKLAQMEEEGVQNGRVLQQCRTENTDLQSELNDSKRRTQDLLRKYEEDEHLWDAEKSNLEGTVAELKTKHELTASEMESMTQKNRELTVQSELIKNQVIALESELNKSKRMTLELLQKTEDDRHLLDEKRSNLEGILADMQTKRENLKLQLSRNKALEQELLSTMCSFEEMKKSTSNGEVQIAKLLAVAQEKDDQLSDAKRQLLAMAEEKKNQLESFQDRLSSVTAGKNILEEENKSLQTELDRRTLDAEEEKVIFEDRVRELQTAFNSLNKELESYRDIAGEKERQFVDFQNQHSELVEEKRRLEKKNASLLTELNRFTVVSDENIHLQNRIKELETAVESLKKDIESKDNRQPPSRRPLAPIANGNGYAKPKRDGVLNENLKPNGVHHEKENGKSKVTPEKPRTVQKRELGGPTPEKQTVQKRELGGPTPEKGEHGVPTPEKRTVQKRELAGPTPKAKTVPPQIPKPFRFHL